MLTLAPAVKPENLEVSRVYARLALFRNLGAIADPVAAGVFIAAGSVQRALVADAVSSVALAAVIHLARLRAIPEELAAQGPVTASRGGRSGVRRLLQSGGGVGASVWMLAMAILFTAALPVAQAQFLLKDLSMSPAL